MKVHCSVAVIETVVLGVTAYRAKCLTCGWQQSKPKDREAQAVAAAKAHGATCPGKPA